MGHQNRPREEWQHDIENRQRNVVFPDTVQNEARFWRNVGNQPWTPMTKIGLGILAIFVAGFLGTIVVASAQAGMLLTDALGMLLICGPIFLAIAWATRRALRNSAHQSKHQK
jgi:hypothetical protein